VILAKERRIRELEEENRKLKQQLNAALGKAYASLLDIPTHYQRGKRRILQ